MWPGSIVKPHVFFEYIVQVAIVQDKDVVKAFMPYRSYPALSVSVGLWSTKWCTDNLYAHGAKHIVE